MLRRFARHYQTGEPMPEALLERLLAARNFNQGFATVEYRSSALVDHRPAPLGTAEDLDVGAFEKETLARIGMPREIVMRHRMPHFTHLFSGDGYAAGYYSYLWSEVMDADAFAAFEEAGDVFDRDTARKLNDFIYSAGNRATRRTSLRRLPRPHAGDPGALEEARPRRGADRRARRRLIRHFALGSARAWSRRSAMPAPPRARRARARPPFSRMPGT